MNDIDDSELEMIDDDDDFEELSKLDSDNNRTKNENTSKRDFRAEIEKKLELMALQKLTGDDFYNENFE
jgi:hypothetical protein